MAPINPDRTRRTVYLRQRIVCVVAAIALLLAATAPGALALGIPGIVLLALGLPQWRGRAPVSWIGTALRYASRARHMYAPGLVPLVAPDTAVVPVEISGATAGAIADARGLAAIIEIGDPDALLVTGATPLPLPAELVGSPTPDEPMTTAQVLVVRRAHFQRLLVAVRVGDDGASWTDAQLRQALSAAVRGVVRRLARSGAIGHALSEAGLPRAISWAVAGQSGGEEPATDPANRYAESSLGGAANQAAIVGGPPPSAAEAAIDESWDHLRIGSALHVTVRVVIRADRLSTDVLARLLAAPAAVVAVSVASEYLMVRLVAPSPALLAAAVANVMATCPAAVVHLDGEQRAGLAATLPLGLADQGATGRRSDSRRPRRTRTDDRFAQPSRPVPVPGLATTTAAITLPDGGLLLGRDRRGAPVFLQIDPDRRTPIRLAVVGGPAAARVLSGRIRAMSGSPGISATPQVAIAVFERLTPSDGATLASADVVVCQPVPQPEAVLVASALRLTRAGAWLSRIDGDMIAIISGGSVRWAQLSAHASEPRRHTGLTGMAGVART